MEMRSQALPCAQPGAALPRAGPAGGCANLFLECSCEGSARVYSLPRVWQGPHVQYLYIDSPRVCNFYNWRFFFYTMFFVSK